MNKILPPDPPLTPALIDAHGISESEYALILETINRPPTYTELGIFSAMWNEHCSYKSSKKWLATLPTTGAQVICGPGENAGIIDIGDNLCVAFKMESHNHPSFIEPFQGAATGMGGILRDIFTMGARPIAAMNSLSFGDPKHPKTKSLVHGVIAGIGGYGNCFGVPTIGGEVRFHHSYNENCLVNAFAAGLVERDKIFYSAASGVGMPIVYLGAKTGRDGVGGASMASAGFDDSTESKRPTVQIGDPFTEKCLMEATLELMATGAVISIQDMGAAGLTCSAVEMGDKGDLGIHLRLDDVPIRESAMTAYEMMLSESQERMLMVLNPELEAEAKAVFDKWDLDFAIVGRTIKEDRFIIELGGEIKADLPLKALSGTAPQYDRPWKLPPAPAPVGDLPAVDLGAALLAVIGSANYASKAWVYQQYDSQVMADTVIGPGSDAGIVRVHGTDKALAFSADVTPRYCAADPIEGGKQAVAEGFRNLCASGARPLATTDNLNFGSPQDITVMGQFVGCIKGIAEAVLALNVPIVSGNVSFYNETDGAGILPTPTICTVGLLDNVADIIRIAPEIGDDLVLIGETRGHLGQSAVLKEVFGLERGAVPPVDLAGELRAGEFVRAAKAAGLVSAAHDISDGGLAVAATEMGLAAGCGVVLGSGSGDGADADLAFFFGEDQGRYVLATRDPDALIKLARTAGVVAEAIGIVGGDVITLGKVSVGFAEVKVAFETGFCLTLDPPLKTC